MSWFVYVVRLASGLDRAAVVERLQAQGVPRRAYFPPIHLQQPYCERGYRPGDFPVAEAVAASTLALPFHSTMPEADVEYVCNALTAAIRC